MINPRFLYIAPRSVTMGHRRFPVAHFIDLEDGQVLVSAEFHDEADKDYWEQHTQVEPVAPDGETINERHAAQLTHLGVQSTHRASDIRKVVKKTFKLM
jgi:hypothetical protein